MNKKLHTILLLLLSVLTTFCIAINIDWDKIMFHGNDVKWLFVLIILYTFFKKAFENCNKKMVINSFILATILSTFFALGYAAERDFIFSKKDYIVFICKIEVYQSILLSIIFLIFKKIDKFRLSEKIVNVENNFFTNNKKSLFLVALILFLAYLPYLLHYYPGNVLIDSVIQILQGQGCLELTNHHPVLHTLFIKFCINTGHLLTGSYTFGAFIYTILQIFFTCFTFSYCLYYMAKKKIPKSIRIITLLFFALCPTICFYTVTMYKDIPFSLFVLLSTIGITELVLNTEEFLSHKRNPIILSILITITLFFRNNGVYAFVMCLPIFMLVFKKHWKYIILIFLAPIVIFEIVSKPIYNFAGIEPSSPREALSIPLQQMARIMVYKENELTDEEKDLIRYYIPVNDFKSLYSSGISDPIKFSASEEAISKDKIMFIKVYLRFALKYPALTTHSLILGNYGYYYPNTQGWGVYTGVSSDYFENYRKYEIHAKPILKISFLDDVNHFVNNRDYPILSTLINIGFYFWVTLICIFYLIYKKEYYKILTFLPVLGIWITVLAGPIFAEPRYVYCLFTTLPLFIGLTICNIKKA